MAKKDNHIIIGCDSKNGFTLVELLVVISIISLLLSILMPALNRARGLGRQTVCLAHMRQFGLALEIYAQSNNGLAVGGRWGMGGDYYSVNAFYSNLTPYLDPSKTPNSKVWNMNNADAEKYNQIWEKLGCPSENKASKKTFFQGISIRTIAINLGLGRTPGTEFTDGYGLEDYRTGTTRKLLNIRNISGMMAFCEARDTDYIYTNMYNDCRVLGGYDPEWVLPQRHPSGLGVTFTDGHVAIEKAARVLHGDPYDSIWRIK